MPDTDRRRNLGEILRDLGRITPAEQDRALEYQQEHGGFFGEALIALGFISSEELEFALASQFDLPYVFPDPGAIPREVATLVSPGWALGNLALPISRAGNTLVVVVDSPLKEDVVAEIRHRTGLDVDLAIASPDRIRALIREIFAEADDDEDPADRPVVSVEGFLERAMGAGAERFGFSVRGRAAFGWWRAGDVVDRVALAGGWMRGLRERLHPADALLPRVGSRVEPELDGRNELPDSLLWEGRELPVDVSVLGTGPHREVLVVLSDLPDEQEATLPRPPDTVVREARLLRRAGSGRFAVRLLADGLPSDLLAALPELFFGRAERSVHLHDDPTGSQARHTQGADAAGDDGPVRIGLPERTDEAVRVLHDRLARFHFDGITLAAGEAPEFWAERLAGIAPTFFVRLDSTDAREALSEAGILWEIEVADDRAGGLSWRLFPLNISY